MNGTARNSPKNSAHILDCLNFSENASDSFPPIITPKNANAKCQSIEFKPAIESDISYFSCRYEGIHVL